MEHELGPEIEIHGERPAWLADDEEIMVAWGGIEGGPYPAECVSWRHSTAISLRADHPYYLATSEGFTYWPGGDDAPDDWDGGEVLFSSGYTGYFASWERKDHWLRDGCAIIGYRKRVKQQTATPPRPSDELVERMIAFIKECAENCDEEAMAILAALNPDPMIQRARDICKDEFGVILPDDAPGMRAVLRGLREGGE